MLLQTSPCAAAQLAPTDNLRLTCLGDICKLRIQKISWVPPSPSKLHESLHAHQSRAATPTSPSKYSTCGKHCNHNTIIHQLYCAAGNITRQSPSYFILVSDLVTVHFPYGHNGEPRGAHTRSLTIS